MHPPTAAAHCDCDQGLLMALPFALKGEEGRKEEIEKKVKEMIREDRLDMAVSKREESEMTPKLLWGDWEENAYFLRVEIHRCTEEVRT